MIEVSIKLKNEEKKLSKRYLIEEPFVLSRKDPSCQKMVDDAIKEFGVGEGDEEPLIEEIKIVGLMVW